MDRHDLEKPRALHCIVPSEGRVLLMVEGFLNYIAPIG